MDIRAQVTVVIINYQTPDLTERAIESFRKHYPQLELLLIDNGSRDRSSEMLQHFQSRYPSVTQLIRNDRNRFHGPAMHQAMQRLMTEYAIFLDSDCEVKNAGFIERMVKIADGNGQCYAVGKKVSMNRRGFEVGENENTVPYIRPMCMLVRREMYFKLSPFSHHGTPCLDNMRDAASAAYELVDFPVFEYVVHKGRGTAARYGYGLGWRGKVNHLLQKLGL